MGCNDCVITYRCAKHPKLLQNRYWTKGVPKCPTCQQYMERVWRKDTDKKSKRRKPAYLISRK